MRQTIYLLLLVALVSSSCKKDKQEYILNTTVYLNDSKVNANIGFIPSDQESVINNQGSVTAYFASKPKNAGFTTDQYSTYLPSGNYIIVVQLTESATHNKGGLFTYKKVSIGKESPGFGNIMQFRSTGSSIFQEWNEYKL